MPKKLDYLLAQCDPALPLDETDRAWLNAEPAELCSNGTMNKD